MTHIDEHMLELFVLGDEGAPLERETIEAHLAECAGCSALARAMRSLYGDAASALSLRDMKSSTGTMAMMKRQGGHAFPDRFETLSSRPPMRASRRATLQVFYETARRHPGKAAFASIAVLGLLFGMFSVTMKFVTPSRNPSYVHYNFAQNMIEVYGQDDEKLWDLPVQMPLADIERNENETLTRWTQVVDLDGDGKKEIITDVPIGGLTAGTNTLRIYSADKKILRSIEYPDRVFNYGANHYESKFWFGSFVVIDRIGTGKKEIDVVLVNGRSPSIVARFDTEGTLLGEYYHYGNLASVYAYDVHHDGRPKLILCGVNDAFEARKEWLPVIVVLDPAKITGSSQSLMTPEFGLPPSSAELFYIQIPENDITRHFKTNTYVQNLAITDTSKQLRFYTDCRRREDRQPSFEFLFSRDMKNIEVKSVDQTTRLHDELARQGKVHGTIDTAYLKDLNNAVIYRIIDGSLTGIASN